MLYLYMGDITLDLSRIPEIELERDDLGNVRFSVEGRIHDDQAVNEVFHAEQIEPVSITLRIDTGEQEDESSETGTE